MSTAVTSRPLWYPTRENVLDTLKGFFGDPAVPSKLNDYNETHVATFHFPDAYVGASQKLRDELTDLIVEFQQSWMTSAILPWFQVDGVDVEWDEHKFNTPLIGRVPAEGVSRYITSIKRRHTDRVQRRGIAFIVESDFYVTPAGQKHFTDNLRSIQMSVQETCNYDGMIALLSTPNMSLMRDINQGRMSGDLLLAMEEQVASYAACNKSQYGLERVVEKRKGKMGSMRSVPDSMIISPEMRYFMSVVPQPHTVYKEGGPLAVSDLRSGIYGFEKRSFQDLSVYTNLPFETGPMQDRVNLLARVSMVGEYYDMKPPSVKLAEYLFSKLPGHSYSIHLYDEKTDNIERVDFGVALQNTHAHEKPDLFDSIIPDDKKASVYYQLSTGNTQGHKDALGVFSNVANVTFDKAEVTDVPSRALCSIQSYAFSCMPSSQGMSEWTNFAVSLGSCDLALFDIDQAMTVAKSAYAEAVKELRGSEAVYQEAADIFFDIAPTTSERFRFPYNKDGTDTAVLAADAASKAKAALARLLLAGRGGHSMGLGADAGEAKSALELPGAASGALGLNDAGAGKPVSDRVKALKDKSGLAPAAFTAELENALKAAVTTFKEEYEVNGAKADPDTKLDKETYYRNRRYKIACLMKIIFDGTLRVDSSVMGTPSAGLKAALSDPWKSNAPNMIGVHRTAARKGVLAMLGFLADQGYPVPIQIRLLRPFISHETQSAIVLKAGADTGRTLYGPSDFQVSANTQAKTIEGHFTCHTKATISKPENVSILSDILTSKYVGGCTASGFFSPSTLGEKMGGSAIDPDTSIIAIATPSFAPKSTTLSDRVVSITGRSVPWDRAESRQDIAKTVSDFWNFRNLHAGEPFMEVKLQQFLQSYPMMNHLCFPGPSRSYEVTGDRTSDPYGASPTINIRTYSTRLKHHTGRGHWGADALPGVRSALFPRLSHLFPPPSPHPHFSPTFFPLTPIVQFFLPSSSPLDAIASHSLHAIVPSLSLPALLRRRMPAFVAASRASLQKAACCSPLRSRSR